MPAGCSVPPESRPHREPAPIEEAHPCLADRIVGDGRWWIISGTRRKTLIRRVREFGQIGNLDVRVGNRWPVVVRAGSVVSSTSGSTSNTPANLASKLVRFFARAYDESDHRRQTSQRLAVFGNGQTELEPRAVEDQNEPVIEAGAELRGEQPQGADRGPAPRRPRQSQSMGTTRRRCPRVPGRSPTILRVARHVPSASLTTSLSTRTRQAAFVGESS